MFFNMVFIMQNGFDLINSMAIAFNQASKIHQVQLYKENKICKFE